MFRINLIKHTNHILEIENFWTSDVCNDFISKSESIGYEPAMVQTESGVKLIEHVSNNQGILFEDKTLADSIWNTIQPYVNPKHPFNPSLNSQNLYKIN